MKLRLEGKVPHSKSSEIEFMNMANSKQRSGLSIIEVLTSIVVAMIGVFGVLAMIPFSVKQAQSGLDRDAVTMIARNALAKFEAEGNKFVAENPSTGVKELNWSFGGPREGTYHPTGYPFGLVTPRPVNPLAQRIVCIDPLGITEQSAFNTFPFNLDGSRDGSGAIPTTVPADLLAIESVNLVRPKRSAAGAPIQFTIADARRMFRITDDLVFGDPVGSVLEPDEELNGPAQLYNVNATGSSLNRQSAGSVSWCALAQPNVNAAGSPEVDSYKFYILAFKDRVTDETAEESRMNSAVVTSPVAGTYAQPLSTVTINGVPNEDLRRDDWVMLINEEVQTSPPTSRAARTNLAFARVTNVSELDARITLDGPDFQFSNETRIVHLKNVIGVYERTIALETASQWTAQ